MRRLLSMLFLAAALSACGSDSATEDPAAGSPEAPAEVSSTPTARPIRGMRAIDRARDVSAVADQRALQHDTIR